MHEHDTFVRPGAGPPDLRAASSRFPTDLLEQSARRLRILALLYSFVFLMAGVVAPLAVQAMGDAVDGRADIYSTGCLAYWLLTGKLVFDAATPMALLMQHAQTPPVAPSARTDQPIPRALDELVLACLAKNPADRPQSAGELSRRLAELDGPAWSQDRARQWWAAPAELKPAGRAVVFAGRTRIGTSNRAK